MSIVPLENFSIYPNGLIKGVFMDNEKEKTIESFELYDKDKELIELIRHMNKEDLDKELKDYDELAEKWVREEIEEKYGPENADCEFSSADIFNIWDIYKADSDMSKISVKGIADKILKYTKMYYADNLVGKEAYGYRDMLIKCNRGIQN